MPMDFVRLGKNSKMGSLMSFLSAAFLTAYLADIDEQADDMFFRLVKQFAEKESVTEQLKADNQMMWVQQMNNIRNRVTEIVYNELIYS